MTLATDDIDDFFRKSTPLKTSKPDGAVAEAEMFSTMSASMKATVPAPKSGKHVVLVIGETGSGKSTLINMLTNAFRKGSFDNIRVAIPTKFHRVNEHFAGGCERAVSDVSQSQTDACTAYEFNELGNGISFRFIDTPGLADTRGHKQDERNISKILDVACRETHITAIVVVINGAVPRLLLGLESAMTRFKGSLPDVVLQNIVVVLTNTAKRSMSNFQIEKLFFRPAKLFFMSNSAFSTDPTTWEAADRRDLEADFSSSLETVHALLRYLSEFASISRSAFENLREARFKVKAILHKAQTDMVKLQSILDQLAKAEESMKRHGASAEQFQHFTQQKEVCSKELVDAPTHSTICSECTHMCHESCGLNEISQKGDNAFKNCLAFGQADMCRSCPMSCSFTLHYHARKRVVEKKEKMEEVLQDIKSKYDAAVSGVKTSQNEITTVQGSRKAVQDALDQMKVELESKCRQLKNICSGFNLAEELHITLEQLKREAGMLLNLDAKRNALLFVRSLETMVTTLNEGSAAAVRGSYGTR